MNSAFLCSHDHDVAVPSGMRGEALDRYVLSHSKRVSTFWVTETQARAKRITEWQKSGELVMEKRGYPWHAVISFRQAGDYELASLATLAPATWRTLVDTAKPRPDAEFCDSVRSAAERLLLLQEYIATRVGADGCGTKDHDAASKAVAKLHFKLRKALGYSYPAQGVLKL